MRLVRDIPGQKVLLRVLIANGSSDLSQGITSALSEVEGTTIVGVARKMTQALAMIEIVHPDVVVLDMELPKENFSGVLSWIKELQPAPTIVVLSQVGGTTARLRCLEAGADYFLRKTAKLSDLAVILQQITPARHHRWRFRL
ncbi:MAG: chemotaxis response regulator protein-glutamate methylesterase [Verrucomicrobiales bacterium]|nr:chemotaxis response regulator protein-glutamate methylesterase [Verrucomicrobiales bacterium]